MTHAPADLAHVRFTLNAVINAGGEDHDYLSQRLNSAFGQAIGNGAITGDTAATVEELSANTTLLTPQAAALDEDEVSKWISDQIEDGNMDVEHLPRLMARYALTDPAEMRSELAERMGLFEEEEGGAQRGPQTKPQNPSTSQESTDQNRPDPKTSSIDLSPQEEPDWLAYGSAGRQIGLSLEEQKALLATKDAALSGLRQRVQKLMEISIAERDAYILAKRMASDGELEIDENAGVSIGADNGAYVSMWQWVPYPQAPEDVEPRKQTRESSW
jgi:hypothetical protein